jgi:sec-independent protein translocase protein TatA
VDLLSPWHLLLIFIVALLVFGPRRLPELGGALGRTIREFQRSMKEVSDASQVEQHRGTDAAAAAPPAGTTATTAASSSGAPDGGAGPASSPSDGGPRPL